MNKLTISIVIPVYNEATHIAACLEAIARQSVKPYEVIVVDNNSTDGSAAIAAEYDFVTVITARRQGVVHARNRGFDTARGDIIGRIDADTILSADWVARVQKIFRNPSVGAVTGAARYYDMALAPVLDRIDLAIRRYHAWMLGREVALQGANMAIRRLVWQDIRQTLCTSGGMHEDFDLAIHANQSGHRVVFDETLIVSLGYRQANSHFRDFARYAWLSPRTYALHGLKSQRCMYPVVGLAILGYIPLKLLHRGYDSENQRFSWLLLAGPSPAARVNPATYVD